MISVGTAYFLAGAAVVAGLVFDRFMAADLKALKEELQGLTRDDGSAR